MKTSIQEQIELLQKQYEDLDNQITGTVVTYNDQIKQLQAEGQAKVDELRIKREGTIQAIQTLQNLISLDQSNEVQEDIKKVEPEKEKITKPTNKKKTDKSEKLDNTESKVIENTLSNLKNNISKKSDIPDYLQDAYNK